MKALLLHDIRGEGAQMLRTAGFEVIVEEGENKNAAAVAKKVKKHMPDALVPYLTDIVDASVFAACPNLRIVSNFAVGYNNIDVEAAKRAKVAVANTPYDSYAVAEFTASLAVTLLRRVLEGNRYVLAGKYRGWDPELLIGAELKGKTFGIVGSGRIGSSAAAILSKGFGMNVVYADVVRNERLEQELGAKQVETDDVFRLADVLSLHVNLTDSTHHLADARRLALMKPSAVFINTSRGPVVDEAALVEALTGKKIAGAALDVFEFEPKISKPLLKLQNVVLTPHIASATREVRDEMSRIAAQNIVDFFAGKQPRGMIYLP